MFELEGIKMFSADDIKKSVQVFKKSKFLSSESRLLISQRIPSVELSKKIFSVCVINIKGERYYNVTLLFILIYFAYAAFYI